MAKDISEDDFEVYLDDAQAWFSRTGEWIHEHLGQSALTKFQDLTVLRAAVASNAVNEKHNHHLIKLARLKDNLTELIEKDTWDEK